MWIMLRIFVLSRHLDSRDLGSGKGKGMHLNKTQRLGGRIVGICQEKSVAFRRQKSVAVA